MMKKILTILLFILVLAFPAPGPGKETGNDAASPVFERLTQTVAGIENVAGSFRQERRTSMLKNPVVSTGRFWCEKPDKLRWEVTNPEASGFLVNGANAKQWKGSQGTSEAFDASQNPVIRLIVDQIFAWTKADRPWIDERYTVAVLKDNPIALKLIPRNSRERRYVDHIRIHFEAGTNYVHSVDIAEKSGDSTRIVFSGMTVNGRLQKGLFD